MTARSDAKGTRAVAQITAAIAADGTGSAETIAPLELSDLASVRSFAAAFLRTNKTLDILILNAGVMKAAIPGLTAWGRLVLCGCNQQQGGAWGSYCYYAADEMATERRPAPTRRRAPVRLHRTVRYHRPASR